jgi:hypothetical protein
MSSGSSLKRKKKRCSLSELLRKLRSLVNHYGGNEGFIAHMDEWPKTIRKLVFNSRELMVQLEMLVPIPNNKPSTHDNSQTRNVLGLCKSGHHSFEVIASFAYGPKDTIIRWCGVCGSVVGDAHGFSPKKTYPGAVFKMKTPKISK